MAMLNYQRVNIKVFWRLSLQILPTMARDIASACRLRKISGCFPGTTVPLQSTEMFTFRQGSTYNQNNDNVKHDGSNDDDNKDMIFVCIYICMCVYIYIYIYTYVICNCIYYVHLFDIYFICIWNLQTSLKFSIAIYIYLSIIDVIKNCMANIRDQGQQDE